MTAALRGGSTNSGILHQGVEVITIDSTGTAVVGKFGCNSKTPQASVVVNAASVDLATAIALCNQLRAALIANGICV